MKMKEPEVFPAVMFPVADMKPYPENAKVHSKEKVAALAKSMAALGVDQAIVLDEHHEIIAGHCRWRAAKLNGWRRFPAIIRSDLSEVEKRARRLADNKLAEAEYDQAKLNFELTWLQDQGFDTALTGYAPILAADGDLESVGGPSQLAQDEREEDGEGDRTPPPEKYSPGQVWKLGRHRLVIGDATSKTDMASLMGDERTTCLFTDPPYNIALKPQRGTHDEIQNDNMSPKDFTAFLSRALAEAMPALALDAYAFVWCSWATIEQFAPALRTSLTIKAMHIWVKNNFGLGWYSRPKYEPFFLCLRGDPPKPETAPADVWEHAKVAITSHSCEKPVGLVQNILDAYVPRNASVLDPFLGSGSTLIACELTGRTCFGMEIDPKYGDVILDRWEKLTQIAPILE